MKIKKESFESHSFVTIILLFTYNKLDTINSIFKRDKTNMTEQQFLQDLEKKTMDICKQTFTST